LETEGVLKSSASTGSLVHETPASFEKLKKRKTVIFVLK
jgi:hypothetical protein